MTGTRTARIAIILFGLALCCIVGAVAMALYLNTAPATGPVTISGAAMTAEGVTITGAGARYELTPAESTATFTLTEELRGQPITVVGEGGDVSGVIFLDMANPTGATVGPITIGAANLLTDANQRNRAIQRFILQSDFYPTIVFSAQTISGLPAAVTVGDTVELVLHGDLTIRDMTKPVGFSATVTLVSTTRLRGSAAATIERDDFGLIIPSVPQVANVSQEVILTFDFIADAE